LEQPEQSECATSGIMERYELRFLCGVQHNGSLAAKELISVMRVIELGVCQKRQGP
jgi:hypothetical protein